MGEAFGPFGGLGGSDGLDECLSGGSPPSSGFEDEKDEVLVVLVSCAFGLFSCSGSSGIVVCVGGGVFGALAHSVCYADVDEVVPRVCVVQTMSMMARLGCPLASTSSSWGTCCSRWQV